MIEFDKEHFKNTEIKVIKIFTDDTVKIKIHNQLVLSSNYPN